MKITSPRRAGFTLVEMLTVITIIAVLVGLLFPVIGGVRQAAKKAQAKTDVTQLVTSVISYYTEYGKYPGGLDDDGEIEMTDLIPILNGSNLDENPRQIVFFEGKIDTSEDGGRYGIQESDDFLDPWSESYVLLVDANYDNEIDNPIDIGPDTLRTGVIAYSTGKDVGEGDDDVASWD